MNSEQLQRAASMSAEQLNELPFGAIVVDPAGKILRYNAFEAGMSGLDPQRVIGRNFFRDIAPCTAVLQFEGRLNEFLASDESVSITFDYRFTFAHGAVDVAITFVKVAAANEVLIAVDRIAKPASTT